MSPLTQRRRQAQARWQALSPREQRSVRALAGLVAALLFWFIALAPALHTLRDSQSRRAHIEQQQAQMQALQAQAQALQARTPLARDTAWRSLQGLSAGPGMQLSAQGERVTVQLKDVPAASLATWLTQARSQAQALPVEAHVVRTGDETSDKSSAIWSGSVVLSLPNNHRAN